MFLSFLFISNYAQSQVIDTLIVKELWTKSKAFFDVNQYDSARYYVDLALEQYTPEVTKTQMYLAIKIIDNQIHLEHGEFETFREKSQAHVEFIINNFPEHSNYLADQYTQQGLSYAMAGQLLSSLPLFEKGIKTMETFLEQEMETFKRENCLSSLGQSYNYMAIAKSGINQPDSSDYYYHQSIRAYQKLSAPNPLYIASNYYGLASSSYFQSEYKSAIDYGRQILNILSVDNEFHLRNLADANLLISVCYQNLYEVDSAIHYSEELFKVERTNGQSRNIDIVRAMQNLAKIYIDIGDYNPATQLLEEAIEIEMEDVEEASILKALLYNYLAKVADNKYVSPNASLGYYNQSIDLLSNLQQIPQVKSLRKNALRYSAAAHLNKAKTIKLSGDDQVAQKDYQEAIRRLSEALSIDSEVSRGEGTSDISILATIGQAQLAFGAFDEAERSFKEAIDRAIKGQVEGIRKEDQGWAYLGLAELYHEINKPNLFNSYWSKAEEIFTSLSASRSQLGGVYNTKAKHELKQGYLDECKKYIQEALQANKLNPDDTTSQPDNLINFITYLGSYELMADLSHATYKRTGDVEDLKKTRASLKKYTQEILRLLNEVESRHDFTDKLALYNEAFEKLVMVSHELYQKTNDPIFKEEAFNASQQSRAILLQSSVSQNPGTSFAQLPDSLQARSSRINSRISYFSGLLKTAQLNAEDQSQINEFESRLFAAREEKRRFKLAMEEDYPHYFALQYNYNTLASSEIQTALQPETTYIEYLNGKTEILIFILTKTDFRMESVSKSEDLDQLASSFADVLRTNDPSETEQMLNQLYKQLFEPIQNTKVGKDLIIVPDGKLWNINFELLKANNNAPYLIQEHSISYGYSAFSLFKARKRKTARNQVLAYSFGKKSQTKTSIGTFRGSGRAELPGSALEISNLSEILDGSFFYEESATETSFKEMAGNYNIIHLAIHGEIDELDYDRSRLYFNTELADSLNDGLLYPFELYDMQLNAELAVLSACNSGGGRISKGEGIMSLGRAFQYAGVGSLLLSKWEVSDGVAPEIINTFYQKLEEGLPKGDALRLAKLEFLSKADNLTSAPYYWGSFFILGNNKPVQLRSGLTSTQITILILLFALGASIAFRRSMKKKA